MFPLYRSPSRPPDLGASDRSNSPKPSPRKRQPSHSGSSSKSDSLSPRRSRSKSPFRSRSPSRKTSSRSPRNKTRSCSPSSKIVSQSNSPGETIMVKSGEATPSSMLIEGINGASEDSNHSNGGGGQKNVSTVRSKVIL